jgi:DNA-binding MarR family transcriptional regulator
MQQQIEWRRTKVMELLSKGECNQSEIARVLQVDRSIISRDVARIRKQSRHNIRKYIDERLPEEYEKCLVGLTAILREAWSTSQHTEDRRDKIQALSLAKECYSMKLDLLTNATVVDDAIRFVSESEKSKDKNREEQVKSSASFSSDSSGNEEDNKESEEPDYDDDDDEKSDKVGEEKQEQETGETTLSTTDMFRCAKHMFCHYVVLGKPIFQK